MGHLSPNRLGLVFAGILAGWHAVWSGFVAAGIAQPLADFVSRIHFVKTDAVVEPFSLANAALLVAVTAAVGYLTGFAFAIVWNCLQAFSLKEKTHF